MSGISDALELPEDIDLPQPVTAQLNQRLLWIAKRLSGLSADSATPAAATPTVIVGTRAQRVNLDSNEAGRQAAGTEFYETDTTLTYIARPRSATSALLVWRYMTGNQRGTFANLPAALGGNDAGLLYTVTDKARTLRWTGSAWEFAPWETIPLGYVAGFRSNPGTGWHICDGSVGVTQLNADGSTSSITVEDFSTARYPKWGPTAAGAGAAVTPLITGNTGAGGAHSHPLSSNGTAAATATTAVLVTPSGAVQVAAQGHTHALGGNTDNESAHTHPYGSLVNDALGEPIHYGLVAYQRV